MLGLVLMYSVYTGALDVGSVRLAVGKLLKSLSRAII